jgi:hypothetical protein
MSTPETTGVVGRTTFVKLGLIASLLVLLLGAEHFARYDFANVAFQTSIGPYTTASDRIIEPISIDETQYLSYVRSFRGDPNPDVTELWWPFDNRVALPAIASLIPIQDEAVALAIVSLVCYLAAIWLILDTLRQRGATLGALSLAAILLTVNWNTYWFATGVLIDNGVFFLTALGLWCIQRDRWWALPAIGFVGYAFKESALVLSAALLGWSLLPEARPRRRIIAATVGAAAIGSAIFHFLRTPDHHFDDTPRFGVFMWNLDLRTQISLLVAFGPIVLGAWLRVRQILRENGRRGVCELPVAGFLGGQLLMFYAMWGADLSPRLVFTSLPFAALLFGDYLTTQNNLFGRVLAIVPYGRRFNIP